MEDKTQKPEDSTENDTAGDPPPQQAQNRPATKKRSLPSPHEVIGEHTASMESTRKQQQQQQQQQQQLKQQKGDKTTTASTATSGKDVPTAKRSRAAAAAAASASHQYAAEYNHSTFPSGEGGGSETPPIKTPETERGYMYSTSYLAEKEQEVKTPMPSDGMQSNVRRSHSSGSVSSELSSSSASTTQRHEALSPIPPSYVSEVPPAPPSTPASTSNVWDFGSSMMPAGLMTPLPVQPAVANTSQLEMQQLLMEGAATPAPNRGDDTGPAASNHTVLSEDFSDWAVGDRYEMVRVLGRGSYGEVAQAIDLKAGRSDAFVAIKRIQSPFDQEVDAIRLYREIHILRQMRGHECIIQLVDVVQPPTDDLDDFHDLYLVFEYVDTDLYKLILSPQYLTTQHIQTFLYQMLAGLKFIHSFSVIHRDLKPANILLNEDCSLKICDFGLARIVAEAQMSNGAKERQPDSTDRGIKPKINNFGIPPKMGLTRQLTKHVVTRWYRAPELILIQPYTSAVDIWSLGCILAELLSMQEGNVEGYQDRKPLFPGGTCFPLSGEGKLTNDDKLDQLSVIFAVIGTPSKEDLSTVGKANEYIKSLGKSPGKPLETVFPAADPAALDLLKKMLQFSPKRRLTAEEALDHEFFHGIRQENLERTAPGPLQAPEFLETNHVDLAELKRKIYEEVLWYRDKDEEMNKKMPGRPLDTKPN